MMARTPTMQSGSLLEHMGGIRVSELCFYSGLAIWLVASILNASFYASALESLMRGVRVAALMLMCFGELEGRTGIGRVVGILVAVVLAVGLVTASAGKLVDTLLIVLFARNYPFKRTAKVGLACLGISLALVLLSAYLGIIRDYVSISSTRTRHYLGFRYALYPAQLAFMITCLWVYLREARLSIPEVALLVSLNWYIYVMAQSRLSFYLAAGLVAVSMILRLLRKRKWASSLVGMLAVPSFFAMAILSLALTMTYDPSVEWMRSLNEVLGGRLSLGHDAIRTYGIMPFGQDIDLVGNGLTSEGLHAEGEYNYIDSLFVKMAVLYGWVFLVLFVALQTVSLVIARKRANTLGDTACVYLLLVQLFIAAHCCIDDLSINLYYNLFLASISCLLAVGFGARTRSGPAQKTGGAPLSRDR